VSTFVIKELKTKLDKTFRYNPIKKKNWLKNKLTVFTGVKV